MRYLLPVVFSFFYCSFLGAAEKDYSQYSILFQATSANAGGQEAYFFARATTNWEMALFKNESLLAGDNALFGAVLSRRFTVCAPNCILQFSGNLGLGGSSGGPLTSITWSTVLLWVFRIDFTNHVYFTKTHAVTWSYPLWIGLSFGLPI